MASQTEWGRSLLRRFTLFSLDRLLGCSVDPPGIHADRVFGGDRGAPELVPQRNTEFRDVVVRDQIIAILQYPVERLRMRNEARPVRRPDQLFDEVVDDWAPDAEEISASLLVGGLGAPILALLIAGRQRLREHRHGHVVVEGVHALLVLRRVDRTYPRRNPHALEVFRERQHDALELRVVEQDLEFERLTGLVIDELLALERPTRFFQQL